MINEIKEKVRYEVIDEYFNFHHIFDNKDDAYNAELYLTSLKNFLNFLDYKKDKNESFKISIKHDNSLYFEGINWSHYIEPDWMGHHPDGGYDYGTYSRSSYYNRYKKQVLLAKIYKSYGTPYEPNKWDDVMSIYDDFRVIYPEDKAVDIIKNMRFLSIAGVNIMNFNN